MQIVVCPKCAAKNRVDEARARQTAPVCGRCGTPLILADLSHPMTVTDDSFQRDVLDVRGMPVLVDFWAEWCGPCRMLAPTLDQIAGESAGKYRVAKLNVDQNQRTAGQYNISSIPAMYVFKDGKVVDRLIGLLPKQNILAALSKAV